MMSDTTKPDSWQPAAEMAVDLFDNWFDPIESEVRARAREFSEEMIRGELDTMLARLSVLCPGFIRALDLDIVSELEGSRGDVNIHDLKTAYEKAIGHSTSDSTV